jgi:threonine aldolase
MNVVDLRSDTVTKPTSAMRAAMAAAEVGDDVYGDDPTVNALQARIAGLLGFEAALFVPTGTQSNLCALMAHCGRGDEFIVGQMAHCYRWEGGGAAVLGSIQPQPLAQQPDGSIALADIEANIKPDDAHFAVTRLLALENTWGGKVLPQAYVELATALARRRGLATHLDGARLFNAAVACGRPVTDWTQHVSSVQLCLSKGLAAPVGSMICGSAAFVDRARRMRKILGGGMRQAGVIAAPGIVALTKMVDRLAEDHANAKILAEGVAKLPGVSLDLATVQTNIVVFQMPGVDEAATLQAAVGNEGVLISDFGGGRLRMVTHYGITADDCRQALGVIVRCWARH